MPLSQQNLLVCPILGNLDAKDGGLHLFLAVNGKTRGPSGAQTRGILAKRDLQKIHSAPRKG